jgi:hypothetical protein
MSKKIRFFEKIGFLAERLCQKIRFFEKIGFLAEHLCQKKSDPEFPPYVGL